MNNDTSATVIEVKNLACGYGETVVLQEVSSAVHP
jgi:ABC-type branched-subunit amino acid transport system ATPase component